MKVWVFSSCVNFLLPVFAESWASLNGLPLCDAAFPICFVSQARKESYTLKTVSVVSVNYYGLN